MTARRFMLALSVAIVAPGLLRAQQVRIEFDNGKTGTLVVTPDLHKMYEDVEIFRRILNGKLDALYARNVHADTLWFDMGFPQTNGQPNWKYYHIIDGPLPSQPNTLNWAHPFFSAVNPPRVREATPPPRAEGVYLKGQGVVFTVTLPSLQPTAGADPGGATRALQFTRAPSEWENMRRQVRNENEEPKTPEASKPPQLSDVVLKLLAENGHHFAQLGENESLTIVITVEEKKEASPAPKPGKAPAKRGQQASAAAADVMAKVRNLELLGDLHLKQNKADEAVAAYLKALELKPGTKQTETLYRKLGQAYMIQEQIEKARDALDKAIAVVKRAQGMEETKGKPAPAPKPAAASLPVKLIVSAPKKLLDEAKGGKLSAEEFRRRARVETLTFDGERR